MTENEMAGWHHRLNGHEFEQALGDGEEQGSLAFCSPWSCKELDIIEQLNHNNIALITIINGIDSKSGIILHLSSSVCDPLQCLMLKKNVLT